MDAENKSFSRDGNKIIHTRLLNAPRELVWEAWTNPEHIKEWWGPDEFTVTNRNMQVQDGGQWNFIMHGFGKDYENNVRYKKVVKHSLLVFRNGDENDELGFDVTVSFESKGKQTLLTMVSVFSSSEIIDKLNREVNAIEGGKQTMNRMEAYVNAQSKLYQQAKTNRISAVSTYLNFPGNTEEAFEFYRSVFGGEFYGNGVQRFGDIPAQEGMPPLSDTDKKLILHIGLKITGGHVIMATDSPESFGLKLDYGNNMHINLEPDSREETKRLFDALSAGGKITMELQDMFWGAYYGSFTDKYGINWMVNYADEEIKQ